MKATSCRTDAPAVLRSADLLFRARRWACSPAFGRGTNADRKSDRVYGEGSAAAELSDGEEVK